MSAATRQPADACPTCDGPLLRGPDPIYGLLIERCSACEEMRLPSEPDRWYPFSARLAALRDRADELIDRDGHA